MSGVFVYFVWLLSRFHPPIPFALQFSPCSRICAAGYADGCIDVYVHACALQLSHWHFEFLAAL